ncbi:hypothetical protein M9H77_11073 [Catharanthus roseus]|uniref:Uncharacterized protein n=1 Tax=Catharanthus roseus TaxID=4058 RepID=A0ACC0BDI1_CATRO|nr:hypothetical protein M9H77_11073 [Catharanthus roseus]
MIGPVPTIRSKILDGLVLMVNTLPHAVGYTLLLPGITFPYFEGVARDIEELKKDKGSEPIEQRVGDNHGGVPSPHHQRAYDNVPLYGYYDMPVQKSYPFHESGYQGIQSTKGGRRKGVGGRGYNRPQKKAPRHEAWHEDNLVRHTIGGRSPLPNAHYFSAPTDDGRKIITFTKPVTDKSGNDELRTGENGMRSLGPISLEVRAGFRSESLIAGVRVTRPRFWS